MNKIGYTLDVAEAIGWGAKIETGPIIAEELGHYFSITRSSLNTNITQFHDFLISLGEIDAFFSYYSYNEEQLTPSQRIYKIHNPEKKYTYFIEAKLLSPNQEISLNFFFREIHLDIIQTIITKLQKQFPTKINEGKVNIIASDCGSLELVEFEVEKLDINLELNYGKEFLEINALIHDFCLNKHKGIVLLHGDPGTGKTSYIRYLINSLRGQKKVIYIPPDMANSLSDPGLINFLMDHKNSILIIEDAENIIKSRKTNHNQTVSNLLNLTDGILSDLLKIQVICTFNCEVSSIDSAFLRKGRLVALYKFEALSIENSQKLIDHLGLNHKVIQPMTLADIYNLSQRTFDNKKRNIGFTI